MTAGGDVVAWGAPPIAAGGAPRVVPLPSRAISVAAGLAHAVALMVEGTVVTWGDGLAGNCEGCSSANPLVSPPAGVAGLSSVTVIAAGSWHTAAIAAGGCLVTWGGARVPRPKQRTPAAAAPPTPRLTPLHTIHPPDGVPFVRVAAGAAFTVAMDALGRVWTVGMPCGGTPPPPPRRVVVGTDAATTSRVTSVAATDTHGVALTVDGVVHVWRVGDSAPAAPLPALAGRAVTTLAAGGATLAAVTRVEQPHPPSATDAASVLARWLGAADAKRPPPPLLSQRSVSDDGGVALIAAAGGVRRRGSASGTRRSTVEGGGWRGGGGR